MITFDQARLDAEKFVNSRPQDARTRDADILLHAVVNWMRGHGASNEEVNAFIQLKVNCALASFWEGWNSGYDRANSAA